MKMPNDWRFRYVGEHDWMLDTFCVSPEDMMIELIDNAEPGAAPISFPYDVGQYETADDQMQLLDHEPSHISGVEMLAQLPARDADIVYRHIWEGQTFAVIGEAYGCSRQWAHVLYHRALDKLRAAFPDMESTTADSNIVDKT